MGSRQKQIISPFVCIVFAAVILNGKITNIAANPVINDNFNHQYQRSHRVIGSSHGALGYVRKQSIDILWCMMYDVCVCVCECAMGERMPFNWALLTYGTKTNEWIERNVEIPENCWFWVSSLSFSLFHFLEVSNGCGWPCKQNSIRIHRILLLNVESIECFVYEIN